jgi:hypothetical protein
LTRGVSPGKLAKLRGTGDTDRAYPERDLSLLLLLSTGCAGDAGVEASTGVLLEGGVSPSGSRVLFCGVRSTTISSIAAGAAELLEGAPFGAAVASFEGLVEELAADAAETSRAIATASASTTLPDLVEATALSSARAG